MLARLKNKSGFSLIELIVIIAIVGILLSIAMPAVNSWLPNYRLSGATRDIVSNMQLARIKAISENANCVLSFSTVDMGSYTVFVDDGSGGGTAKDWIQNGTEKTIYTITANLWKDHYVGIRLLNPNFGGNATCGFDSKGLAASGRTGSVSVQNNKGRSKTITLSWGGHITIN